jgi:hypothetical protein
MTVAPVAAAAAKQAWKVAKPVLKRKASKYLAKHGEAGKKRAKAYLGSKADRLIDKGADKIGVKNAEMRSSAKKMARRGIDKGVDAGVSYASKKLAAGGKTKCKTKCC